MLCPKCKFITFDNLLVCGKCQNDLAEVSQALHGTAANVHGQLFLGAVLSSVEADSGGTPEVRVEETLVAESLVDDGVVQLTVDDEPPALEFDDTEIPHIDSHVSLLSEVAAEDSSLAAEEDQPVIEEVSLSVDHDDSGEAELEGLDFSEVDASADTETTTLQIDESELTLDAFADAPPVVIEESQSRDIPQGKMPLDLDEIDLSDLTNSSENYSSADQANVPENTSQSLDFDDTMDLSLLVGEAQDEDHGAMDESEGFSDLSPIDLTLADDALVGLTVDSGRDDDVPDEDSEQDGVLRLSMEDEEK